MVVIVDRGAHYGRIHCAMPETEQTQANNQSVETTRPREYYLTPPVDIYETPESLVVMADMPGIDLRIWMCVWIMTS